jgi:hypothetical protein
MDNVAPCIIIELLTLDDVVLKVVIQLFLNDSKKNISNLILIQTNIINYNMQGTYFD